MEHDVAISGEPGMVLWTMFDLAHDYLPLAVFDGALVLTAQATGFGLSSLDTNGAGCVGFAVPNGGLRTGLRRDRLAAAPADHLLMPC